MGLSLVVAGLGGSRSEKRAVGLSLVVAGGFRWLAGKRKNQSTTTPETITPAFPTFNRSLTPQATTTTPAFPSPSHHHHAGLASPINHHAGVSNLQPKPNPFRASAENEESTERRSCFSKKRREHREKREHRMKREKKSIRNELREKTKKFILVAPTSFFNRV